MEMMAKPITPIANANASRLSKAATILNKAKPPAIGRSLAAIDRFEDAGASIEN